MGIRNRIWSWLGNISLLEWIYQKVIWLAPLLGAGGVTAASFTSPLVMLAPFSYFLAFVLLTTLGIFSANAIRDSIKPTIDKKYQLMSTISKNLKSDCIKLQAASSGDYVTRRALIASIVSLIQKGQEFGLKVKGVETLTLDFQDGTTIGDYEVFVEFLGREISEALSNANVEYANELIVSHSERIQNFIGDYRDK